MSMIPSVFLAVPRVPTSTEAEELVRLLRELTPQYLAPLQAYLDHLQAAQGAVFELEESRPAGPRWREAQDADAEAALAGKQPEVWQMQQLLDGEHARWARASALCRTVTVARKRAFEAVDRAVVQEACEARLRDLDVEFGETARAAYRVSRDPAEGWRHLNRCTEIIGEYRAPYEVFWWAKNGDRVDVANSAAMPGTPHDRGYYLAAQRHLDPDHRDRKFIMLPRPEQVVWPAEDSTTAAELQGFNYGDLSRLVRVGHTG